MAWAPNQEGQYRMAARYVDKIFRGAKPGDLPVSHPGWYYLSINKSAAPKGVCFDNCEQK
jgi:putative tryptophan/tyrosine transport system substrate-binding protein